ncbi:hypothetical protein BpHYR1_017152 [Brachionus plicatilis]|uniref:Uncharacterized protein n=1 Tax=Brachionus plicatilis TaxID=10195 RepID=A0A3M7T3G4_BRAPC|nr:hypothetical protein BpHYR1_017152 [Brachionus plicatilis]
MLYFAVCGEYFNHVIFGHVSCQLADVCLIADLVLDRELRLDDLELLDELESDDLERELPELDLEE